jgi:hypothetical protein
MNLYKQAGIILCSVIMWAAAATTASAAGIVGTGSPISCDNNDLAAALMGGGLVTFNCGDAVHTITTDTYVINEDTEIRGNNRIILDGENLRQQFIVNDGATLILKGITLINGQSAQGGCIAVNIDGELETEDVTFRGCHDISISEGGGAVYNLGSFDALNTVFESNRTEQEGGAVFNRGSFEAQFVIFEANSAGDDSGAVHNEANGEVEIVDSVFIGNSALGGGGAIGNFLSMPDTDGSLEVIRSLFVDNQANTFGGAINNVVGEALIANVAFVNNRAEQGGAVFASSNSVTRIIFSTFTGNRADTGSGIYRPLTGIVELGYSILAGGRNRANTADELECDGPPLVSQGYNLIEDNSCVDGNTPTDIRDTPAELGPLQDNGGFMHSVLPGANSPALGKVPAGQCVPRDQRSAHRIGPCDIGAVERGGLFDSAYLPRVHRQR